MDNSISFILSIGFMTSTPKQDTANRTRYMEQRKHMYKNIAEVLKSTEMRNLGVENYIYVFLKLIKNFKI